MILRAPVRPQRGQTWLLALMGGFDAVALGLVTAAGALPRAEYASVTSSLFGVLTVLLAAWFLRERVRAVQWLGIAAVFGGHRGAGVAGVKCPRWTNPSFQSDPKDLLADDNRFLRFSATLPGAAKRGRRAFRRARRNAPPAPHPRRSRQAGQTDPGAI
ncbi:EamA family transporter [Tabrizicola sp.]|uniref:EamA family transporter n=1 Tax=Tabrizicola sp. TaxID=2005166 RepID=UPI003BB0E260